MCAPRRATTLPNPNLLKRRLRCFPGLCCRIFLAAVVIVLVSTCTNNPGLFFAQPQAAPQNKKGKSSEDERKRKDPPRLDNPDPDRQDSQVGKPFRFGVQVDLVVLPLSVVDKNGDFVSGLAQGQFQVYEDKVSQTISHFGQFDLPVSLGLIIDTSGSMRPKIAMVNQAAMLFLKLSNPKDETFLIGFNDEVSLVEDFTDDLDTIRDALDNLTVTGGTSLYDATLLATQKVQKGSRQKHALLIISDGEDRDSYYKLPEVLRVIQEASVQIYVVGILSPEPEDGLFDIFTKNPQEKAREALTKIAQETGGKAFFPKDVTELPSIAKNIATELRSQYHIGYLSTNPAKDGTWRSVQVVLTGAAEKQYRLRTRTGYFAPK